MTTQPGQPHPPRKRLFVALMGFTCILVIGTIYLIWWIPTKGLANFHPEFTHGDPADRIIAATALKYKAPLLTIDTVLQSIKGITTIW